MSIPIGIVGLNFGASIAKSIGLASGGCLRTAAVCDFRIERSAALAAEIGDGCRSYGELGEMLADPGLEAIGVFTRPHRRAELIRRCLEAGKAVLTTKPFEEDPTAAADVLAFARTKGIPVHANSPGPALSPDLQQIQDWRTQHQLGRIIWAQAMTWASYHEQEDGSWKDDPRLCPAAPLTRLGIYAINDLVALLGQPSACQVVSSRIRTGRPTADNAQAVLTFPGGAIGSVAANFCTGDGNSYANSLVLTCERGTIWRNCGPRDGQAKASVHLRLQVGRDQGGTRLTDERMIAGITSGSYRYDLFADAVRGRWQADPAYDQLLVSGVRVLRAISEAEARLVTPAKIGHPAATASL